MDPMQQLRHSPGADLPEHDRFESSLILQTYFQVSNGVVLKIDGWYGGPILDLTGFQHQDIGGASLMIG